MTENINLIVLGTTKFGENACVLHTLSREHGRRGFMLRVGKKTSQALFSPLSLIEADIVPNPKSQLWTAKNVTARHPLNGIRSSMTKNSMTMFMSEVLLRAVHEGMAEDGIYEWLENSVVTLDSFEGPVPNYPIRFLLEMASAMGFRPSREDLLPFAPEHRELLEKLLEAPLAEFLMMPMKGEQRNSLCESLVNYLGFHLDFPLKVQSLAVLRELYR